jgi:hypothetical protein
MHAIYHCESNADDYTRRRRGTAELFAFPEALHPMNPALAGRGAVNWGAEIK